MMKNKNKENANIQLWEKESYVEHYNKVYPLPLEDMVYYASFLNPNKESNILDLGCGNASFLAYCRSVFGSTGHLVGVDVSPFQEQADIEKPLNIKRIQSDFLSFVQEKSDLKFDFILARASLHHLLFEEKKRFFSLLKENGFLNECSCDFILHDMIFEFDTSEVTERLPSLIQEAEKFYGDRFPLKRQDIIDTWFKEEPESLSDWCLAAAQAGFELLERKRLSSFISILHFRNSKLG